MSAEVFYKVLTAEGHAPFVRGYEWSLPTKGADGAWTPGEWHEHEGDLTACYAGLHITREPEEWFTSDDYRVFVAEYEGRAVDLPTEHKLVCRRVRLLREVDAEVVESVRARRAEAEAKRVEERAREQAEAEANRAKWEAEREEREAKWRKESAEAKAKKLAEARRVAKLDAEARAAAGVGSKGLEMFRILAAALPGDSWRTINDSRWQALRLCVTWLDFDRDDIATIHKDFRGGYWLHAEILYSHAVESKNTSACVSLEKFLGRKPFWFRTHDGRSRLHVGARFYSDGKNFKVTSFRDDYLNAKVSDEKSGDARVYKFTRAQLDPKAPKGADEARS